MKKFLSVLFCVGILLILCSCEITQKVPELSTVLDNDVTVSDDSGDYQCHIQYVNPSTAVVTMKTPDSLKGLTFRRADGKYALSLGSLICKGDTPLMTDEALPVRVTALLDSITKGTPQFIKTTKEGYLFKMTVNNAEVSMLTDENGKLQSIETQKLKLKKK